PLLSRVRGQRCLGLRIPLSKIPLGLFVSPDRIFNHCTGGSKFGSIRIGRYGNSFWRQNNTFLGRLIHRKRYYRDSFWVLWPDPFAVRSLCITRHQQNTIMRGFPSTSASIKPLNIATLFGLPQCSAHPLNVAA